MKKRLIGSLLFGALFMASSSVFVSCADYDDDINANKADIIAAQNDLTALKGQLSSIQSDLQGQLASLQTQLTNLKSDYETKIAQAQSELNAAIAKKADQSEIDALTQKLADLRLEFTNKVNAVEQRIAAVESAIEQIKTTLAGKADQSYVDNAIATITAALNGLVSKEDFAAVKNDVETLKTNLATLQALAAGFATKADVDKQIEAVNAAIAKLQSDFEAALAKKADLSYVDGQVEKVNEAVNTLKGQIADINQAIKDIQAALATKANAEDLTNLDADLTKKINELNDALANKINEVQTYVTTYLVTNEKFDAAIELLNTTIANLKKSLEDAIALKADQSEVDKKADQAALQAAIDRIAALEGALVNINTLITNLQDNKANKADVDAAIANLQGQLNTLNAKIDAKDPQTLIDAALVSVKADIENIKATLALKADQTYVDAQLALVQDSLDIVAASVKDIYTKLAAVSGDLTAAEARLKALIDGLRADMNDSVKALNSKINLANAAIEDLKIQDKTILAFLGDITKGTLASQLAALKAEMSDDAAAKVAAEHQAMLDSVLKVKAAINKLEGDLGLLAGRVGTLEDNYAALRGEFDVLSGDYTDFKADLADKLNKIDEQLAAYSLDNLKVLIKSVLTSITLIPDLYIDGIEAIRFRSISYVPQVTWYNHTPVAYSNAEGYPGVPVTTEGDEPAYKIDFADHQLQDKPRANTVIIDNGQTTVRYRLSPVTVPDTAINKEGITMVSKTTDTETRALYNLKENDPVKPVFENLSNGILTVKLQKTSTASLRFAGEGNQGTIVSLKVPRKATKEGIEAADIYSEFSLLDEEVITPRLAALNLNGNDIYKASNWKFNMPTPHPTHTSMADSIHSMHYHYIDSLHIFSSVVDRNLYVKVEADYDKPFDLLNLVTGCYNVYNEDGSVKQHKEINKADLAQYGLAFRFELPQKYNAFTYEDWMENYTSQNYNYTDQQPFAKLSENNPHNIITPVLPNAEQTTGNRAIIGKEPIVRAMLVDTVRGNLIDQAYFKVKWMDNTPDKPEIPVEFVDSGVLNCQVNSMVVRWDKFINEVYAKLLDSEGNATGMSWNDFRKYYPQNNVWRTSPTNARFTDLGSSIEQRLDHDVVTIYWLGGTYTSPNADANELWWSMDEDFFGTILPAREKWYTTTIKFVSNDPKVYGPIVMTLKYKVKMPDTPKIVGYNHNQWFVQKEKFYVQPVQYGTVNNKNYRPDKVEFDFNITQQFVVTTSRDAQTNLMNGTWTNWIVKNFPSFNWADIYGPQFDEWYACGAWDVEFAAAANGLGYHTAYKKNNKYAEPNLASQLTSDNLAYNYIDGNGDDALKLWWYYDYEDGVKEPNAKHYSWTNWDSEDRGTRVAADVRKNPFFILHGDTATADQIIPLLNPLSQENRSDGWTPEKTYDDNKAIDMTVWAKYNSYNYEPITSFKAYLVTPIRINFTAPGAFEDNHISGTRVNAAGNLSITDFVGYAVAKSLNSFTAAQRTQERYKYAEKLWVYYGLSDPEFQLGNTDIIYGLKKSGGNLVVDHNVTIDATGANIINGGLTGAQVAAYTANGYVPSLTLETDPDTGEEFLLYKNLQGREFEDYYNIFVPVTVKHVFGTLTTYVPFPVYPKGKAEGDGWTIINGPEVTSRMR